MTMPDFIIIGAMKCGTSTLHDQLARSDAFYMSHPKEPNFFSDDQMHQRGLDWYRSLFAPARPDQLTGEASTHYTKRPTLPEAAPRLAEAHPGVKLVYIMRDPIERLISHYIHAWSQREVKRNINKAVYDLPELIDYGRYAYQLRPYLERFGPDQVLPICFERMKSAPHEVLNEISSFVDGPTGDWSAQLSYRNPSNQRLRKSRVRSLLVDTPGLSKFRRRFIPKHWREQAKRFWTLPERPSLSERNRDWLVEAFDADLHELGRWLGRPLSCHHFYALAEAGPLSWSAEAPKPVSSVNETCSCH